MFQLRNECAKLGKEFQATLKETATGAAMSYNTNYHAESMRCYFMIIACTTVGGKLSADAYLKALAHFNECDAEVSQVAVDVLGVGNQLQNNRAYFTFSYAQSDLPREASVSRQSDLP